MAHLFGPGQTLLTADTVSSPARFGRRDGDHLGNKNAQLRDLAERFGVAPRDILFFDDSATNVVCSRDLGVHAVQAAPFTAQGWRDCGAHAWLAARGVRLPRYDALPPLV